MKRRFITYLATLIYIFISLSNAYAQESDADVALKYYTNSAKMTKGLFGPGHMKYAKALSDLAAVHFHFGNYEEAASHYVQSADIVRELKETESEFYLNLLNNIYVSYSVADKYNEALRYALEENAIRRKSNNPDYQGLINNLSNLSNCYRMTGDSFEAVNYALQSLGLCETHHSDSEDFRKLYASSLSNTADAYNLAGDYNKAIEYNYRSLELTESCYGTTSYQSALIYNSLGIVYNNLGNYGKAIEMYKAAAETHKKLSETYIESGNYATVMSNIGLSYTYLKDYDNAIAYFKQAEKIYEGKEDFISQYLSLLINKGLTYHKMRDYETALDCSMKAFEVLGKMSFVDEYAYSALLNNTGNTLEEMGDIETAIEYYSDSKKIRGRIFGYKHPLYSEPLHNLALSLCHETPDDAAVYAEEIYEITKLKIRDNFSYLTEYERELYWEKEKDDIELIMGIAAMSDKSLMGGILYNTNLIRKGLLLNTTVEIESLIAESGDISLMNDLKRMRHLRAELARLYEVPISERPADIREMEEQAVSIEQKLMREAQSYGDYIRNLDIDWHDIQQALNDNDLAVEFSMVNIGGENTYCASVLHKGWNAPRKIILDVKDDDMAGSPDESGIYENAKFGKKVWAEILKYADHGDNIYFSPDGMLHQIGAEYLMTGHRTRIGDKYNMYRLSSTRQLVSGRSKEYSHSAVLYGGLNYNTDIEGMQYYAADYERGAEKQSGPDISNEIKGKAWGYLKGTYKEVEKIRPMLIKNRYSTTAYTGEEGVEESFKALSGKSTGIIHIATHGFYLPHDEHNDGLQSDEDIQLNRSGLIFSGANNAWVGRGGIETGIDDGILTAREISKMDLRGTDMVVMSACQTGLGKISGEGVFGLQRAFKKAGADSIIMSLWSVNDEATEIMMTTFYQGLTSGMDKYQAFKTAQDTIKSSTFTVNGVERSGTEPFFWAPFVILD